jgi:CBS domain-containing protein
MGQLTTTVGQLLKHKGSDVAGIGPDATVIEALQLMAQKNIGCLVVLKDGDLVGMFSERDYARKVVLKGRTSREMAVREAMTGNVCTVGPDESIERCMQVMTEHRIRHLPVVSAGKLVGIVSIGDVVKEVITAQDQIIEQLQSYISGR